VLPHWIMPIIAPPPPVEQVVVETGHSLKQRLIARAKGEEYKGEEYQAPKRETSKARSWSGQFSAGAVALGLLAIVFAVLALIFREEKLLAGVSAALGVSAIAVEVSIFVIGVFFTIALIYAVLDHIDLF
jgi:hypothetical protein